MPEDPYSSDDPNSSVSARLEAALNAQAEHAYDRAPILTATRSPRSADEPITIAPTPIRPSRRRPGVAIGAAVMGVAAVAAATIAFANVGPSSGQGSTRVAVPAGNSTAPPTPKVATPAPPTPVGAAAGQKLLAHAAAARVAAGDPTVPAGSFLLQKTVSAAAPLLYEGKTITTVNAPAGAYALDRTWRPADQNDVWTRQEQTVGFPAAGAGVSRWSGVCDDLYQGTQDPPPGSGCSRPGGFDDISPSFVKALPRDPGALYAQLRSYARTEVNPEKVHSVDSIVVRTIDGLFYSDAVPADLASSLIKALALVPSIHVVNDVTTYPGAPGGRTGFGVQVTHVSGSGTSASRLTDGIILDPKTGAYLGDYSGRPGTKNYGPTDVTVSVVDGVPAAH